MAGVPPAIPAPSPTSYAAHYANTDNDPYLGALGVDGQVVSVPHRWKQFERTNADLYTNVPGTAARMTEVPLAAAHLIRNRRSILLGSAGKCDFLRFPRFQAILTSTRETIDGGC
jgi:hypothetical protein